MVRKFDITVVIPTYNRAEMLGKAIESVLSQAGDVSYELVVVDNNSDDDTRFVVERYIQQGGNIRYLFEEKQGPSNARNLGIANSTSEILAFLDDDVRARPDWLERIKRSLDQHPEISFVGGKVLPEWKQTPPAWLTSEHWWPLALVDYGSEAFIVCLERRVCLVSANLAVRRSAFDKVGGFSPELMTCEDHEFEFRLIEAGDRGMYVPELVVAAEVQIERLSKKYHRSWYMAHGRTLALMRAYHIPGTGVASTEKENNTDSLFDVPSYVYRQCFDNVIPWIKAKAKRDGSKAFYYELQARNYFSYIREIQRRSASDNRRSRFIEAINFASTLARKKIRKYTN